ncbi:MAG: hypothetical protein ACOYLV_11085 [Rubrivivax sp.]
MHLLVPFAAVATLGGRAAAGALQAPDLPGLVSLLAQLKPHPAVVGPAMSLTAPHEAVIGRLCGHAGADGTVPLAALQARRLGLHAQGSAWGRLAPAHWRLGTEQVSMLDPQALGLDEPASRAFLDSVRPLFESEGFAVHFAAPHCWLLAHPCLAGLPCASLDRVVGRNVDPWLPADPRARLLRRLQNEVQMLWHAHPLNAAREARGELVVNSVWLSGCGAAAGLHEPVGLVVEERLRAPALAEDLAAWQAAWRTLDAQLLAGLADQARAGAAVTLTLCGEAGSRTFGPARRPALAALAARLLPGTLAAPAALLEGL